MNERFLLEHNEAAPETGAAFILDRKSGLRAQIIRFATLRELDTYQSTGALTTVRRLPILLEISADQLGGQWIVERVLSSMERWYYHTQLMPPPAGTRPV